MGEDFIKLRERSFLNRSVTVGFYQISDGARGLP